MTNSPFPAPFLKIREAAEVLNIPWTTLRDYATAERVQHTRIGRHIRFSAEDIEAIRADGVRIPVSVSPPPSRPRPARPTGLKRRVRST